MDIATFELSERASDAAFGLATAFSYNYGAAEEPDGDQELENSEDDEDGEPVFPWEETPDKLPKDLSILWKRYGAKNDSKFETRHLLEQVPHFVDLPANAAKNNMLTKYEQTGHLGRHDKQLKISQQFLLNSLRVQAKVYGLLGEMTQAAAQATDNRRAALALLQENWAYTAAQVAELDVERKESVLPGSSAGDQDVLFEALSTRRLNRSGS